MLDGLAVKSPLDMPIQARILILSDTEYYRELKNIDQFDLSRSLKRTRAGGATFVSKAIPAVKVEPQPETWVHMAQMNWAKKNATDNYQTSYEGNAAQNDGETQTKIIAAIQEEQERVYQQDQRLMRKLHTPDEAPEEEEEVDPTLAWYDEAHGKYLNQQLENDLIKYILQKIVAMRE
jgi:hypothetical protein